MTLSASEQSLEQQLIWLESSAASFAQQLTPEGNVRQQYIDQTRAFAKELTHKVKTGQLAAFQAARQAQEMRNLIMEAQRLKSTSLGVSIAQFLKKEGKTLAELETKYASAMFGKDMASLSREQRDQVWRKIVEKSGAPRASASNGAKWMTRAGKGLFLITVCVAVYNIAQAENKLKATANEGAIITGSLAGGAAGAAAGLACGPAAIVCVPFGAFVGAVLGGMGGDYAFDSIWK